MDKVTIRIKYILVGLNLDLTNKKDSPEKNNLSPCTVVSESFSGDDYFETKFFSTLQFFKQSLQSISDFSVFIELKKSSEQTYITQTDDGCKAKPSKQDFSFDVVEIK